MHPVIVADIKAPAIIGMDFMTEFGCSLDLKKSLMKVRDIEINMWHESSGKPKTCMTDMKVRDIEINMWHESSGKPKTCMTDMWDSLLFSDGHKASRPTSKKKRHLCLAVASSCHHVITSDQSSYFLVEILKNLPLSCKQRGGRVGLF